MRFIEAFAYWTKMSKDEQTERLYLENGIKDILIDLKDIYYRYHTGGWIENKPYVWISSGTIPGSVNRYKFEFNVIEELVERVESFLQSSGYDTNRVIRTSSYSGRQMDVCVYFTEKSNN